MTSKNVHQCFKLIYKPLLTLQMLSAWFKSLLNLRLLKISLSNIEEKINILKTKAKLRASTNPENVRNLCITPDLTPLEQKKNKVLRQQLADLNKNERVYIIKKKTGR